MMNRLHAASCYCKYEVYNTCMSAAAGVLDTAVWWGKCLKPAVSVNDHSQTRARGMTVLQLYYFLHCVLQHSRQIEATFCTYTKDTTQALSTRPKQQGFRKVACPLLCCSLYIVSRVHDSVHCTTPIDCWDFQYHFFQVSPDFQEREDGK